MSDYIVNPIKKVLSVRIYLPKKTCDFLGGHQLKKHPVFSDGLWLIQCFTNSFDYHSLVLILTFVFTGSIQACVQSLALSVALRGGFPGPEQSQVQNELYFLIECVSRYIVCPVKVYWKLANSHNSLHYAELLKIINFVSVHLISFCRLVLVGPSMVDRRRGKEPSRASPLRFVHKSLILDLMRRG